MAWGKSSLEEELWETSSEEEEEDEEPRVQMMRGDAGLMVQPRHTEP